MFNLDAITNKNNKNDDKKLSYRMLIIGPSGSGKINALLNLIQKQNNGSPINKIHLYAKDLSEPKYQILIERRELNILTLWMMYTTLMITIQKKERNFNCV